MTRKQQLLEALKESPKIPIELEPWEHELLTRYGTNLDRLLQEQCPMIIQIGSKPEDEKMLNLLEKIEALRKKRESSAKEISHIFIRVVEHERV